MKNNDLEIGVFLCRYFFIKKQLKERMMFLAKTLKVLLSASIAFDRTNALWTKPKPILQTERANTKGVKTLCVCSFSVAFSLEL